MTDDTLKRHIIVFGSARKNGDTKKVIDLITQDHPAPFIDLTDHHITPFDYEHRNKNDDFIPLIEKIITYDTIIIATPIYWYQMSTHHKIFIDRFSDLLTIRKDLVRQQAGKNLFVISSFRTSYPWDLKRPGSKYVIILP